MDLIIDGQHKLREFFRTQQETLRRQEKQKQQLESALKNVNPNSSVETYTIQTDEDGEKFVIQSNCIKKFINCLIITLVFKVLSEGPLFPPEHELTLKAEGLEKPKRKRGRPPKAPPSTEDESKENDKLQEQEQEEEEADAECELEVRKKRKIKVPSRFQEAVQVAFNFTVYISFINFVFFRGRNWIGCLKRKELWMMDLSLMKMVNWKVRMA